MINFIKKKDKFSHLDGRRDLILLGKFKLKFFYLLV